VITGILLTWCALCFVVLRFMHVRNVRPKARVIRMEARRG
jgi:hypothetical protein